MRYLIHGCLAVWCFFLTAPGVLASDFALNLVDVRATSAVLTWDQPEGAEFFVVGYSQDALSGSVRPEDVIFYEPLPWNEEELVFPGESQQFTLYGLSPDTDYDVVVWSGAKDMKPKQSEILSVSTSALKGVEDLSVEEVREHAVVLNWTMPETASHFVVEVRPDAGQVYEYQPTSENATELQTMGENARLTIHGLTTGEGYDFILLTFMGEGDVVGIPSNLVSATVIPGMNIGRLEESSFGLTPKGVMHQDPVELSNVDSDQDGLNDAVEQALGLNPSRKDTDEDGYEDLSEINAGYSPWLKGRPLFEDMETLENVEAIKWMIKLGSIRGDVQDAKFHGERGVTRAEFLKMLYQTFPEHMPPYISVELMFSDIPSDHWVWPYLEEAVYGGLVNMEREIFEPNRKVTRAEAIKMLVMRKQLVLDGGLASSFVDVDGWKVSYVEAAKAAGFLNGWVEGDQFYPDRDLTRQEVVGLFYAAK